MITRVRSKVWFEKDGKLVFGAGKAKLLKAIREHKSINKAALDMGISFRSAWSRVTEIERRLGIILINRKKGGRYGGGSTLTKDALDIIGKYELLEKNVREFTDTKYKEIFAKWKR